MAMGGDAANWAHFYPLGSHPSPASAMFGHGPAESTVVTTAAASSSSSTPSAAGGGGGCGPQMGRAGKIARRRSRASRRAPTTLLNTDTANFRAMVQQFTGIPSAPPGAHLPPGGGPNVGPVINFGPVFGDPARSAPTVVSFAHIQQQQQPPYMDQFHYSRPMFTQNLYNNNNNNNNNNSNNNNTNTTTGSKNDQDIYVHGYGGGVSSNSHTEMSEGFIFDGVHDHMMLPKTTPSTNSRVDGYFS